MHTQTSRDQGDCKDYECHFQTINNPNYVCSGSKGGDGIVVGLVGVDCLGVATILPEVMLPEAVVPIAEGAGTAACADGNCTNELEQAVQIGHTIWDDIVATQPNWQGTLIPRSFEIQAGAERFWVHGNATEHMYEYILSASKTPWYDSGLGSQTLLTSFQSALRYLSQSSYTYDTMYHVNEWEIIISAPRAEGLLPVVKHTLFK